ncbi:protein SIEVE ELEMENT OCCLUSION B-like [Hevea brasiliensis]|uniref:protein SIEVE ELEMENT OCCLUSION B-like n=1 Tax=Hevea brasiliensis TaxID=3981 RepID=UPI0025E9E7F7|nr:protein SIEVE ELEMENT OCCLUSION B-like [Hevea brasiliensis]
MASDPSEHMSLKLIEEEVESHAPAPVFSRERSSSRAEPSLNTLIRTQQAFLEQMTQLLSQVTEAMPLPPQPVYRTLVERVKNDEQFRRDRWHERKEIETYQKLLSDFQTTQIDCMRVLKALIKSKDYWQPLLFHGATKKRVNIDVLRRKNVLLLVSGLDISHDELLLLVQIYNESRVLATRLESKYEVVWIPNVDCTVPWNDSMQKQFEALQATMPWCSVDHSLIIEKVVFRFIKEVWHFRDKPIRVVLDRQGLVVCPNALPMMWIWGSNAFPFTSLREESLWKEETWRLDLLVDEIDPTILNWIKEEKYIFLYGDDVGWVRRFTNNARAVALAASVPLEMVYVGKSSKGDKVQRVIDSINFEKFSYVWQDLTMIWFFWIRLESMLFSKIQLVNIDENEPIMQEIKKLLRCDKEGGWAVLSKGSNVVVNGHSTIVLPTLIEYDLSFKEHHDKLHGVAHPCCPFEFPSTAARIPEHLKCPECQRVMEKYSTFLCCHEEGFAEIPC